MVPYRSFPQCCFFCPKRKIPRLTKSNTKIERFQATVLECLKKPFYLSGWCFSMNGSMRSLAPSTAFWLWAHRQARNRFPYSIHLEHGRNRITPKRLRLTHNFDCSAVFRIRYPTGSLLNAFLDPDPDTLKKTPTKMPKTSKELQPIERNVLIRLLIGIELEYFLVSNPPFFLLID